MISKNKISRQPKLFNVILNIKILYRSQSTQGVYNRTLRKIEDFLTSRLESLLDLDQESLADYLYKQDKDQEKYSAVKNIKVRNFLLKTKVMS